VPAEVPGRRAQRFGRVDRADDHDEIVGRDSRARDRFIRRCHCISDDGEHVQCDALRQWLRHDAKAECRHSDVSREAAVTIIARHELLSADGRLACRAGLTSAARNDGRDNHGAANPFCDVVARGDDAACNLMPEDERKGMSCRNPVVGESDIGVAEAACSHLHDDLIDTRFDPRTIEFLKSLAHRSQAKSMNFDNAAHAASLAVRRTTARQLRLLG